MPLEPGVGPSASVYFEIQSTEYLEPELTEVGSKASFRIPDEWWLTEEPIKFPALQLRAARNVKRLPDFFYYNVLPIVSSEVRLALTSLGGFKGEFHPVKLVKNGGRSDGEQYWYFRLFTRVDAIDRQRSEIECFPGTTRPKRVWQLRLGPIASELNVFRLQKVEALFVSRSARDALASCHLGLSPAEDFRLGW